MPVRVGPLELLFVLFVCLVPVVIAAVVAAVVVWLSKRRAPAGSQGGGSSLEILKERYARGELTHEQYEEMRRALEQ